MKTKKTHRKLDLNKGTIVNLDSVQLGKIGGEVTTPAVRQAWPWLTEEMSYCPETCETCGCPTNTCDTVIDITCIY